MTTNWYTSDSHFGHANIARYCSRPSQDVQEMNDMLVEKWNSVVKPGDTVFHMGDISMGPRGLGPVKDLNGTIVLIAGNHDTCWRYARAHKGKDPKLEIEIEKYREAGIHTIVPAGRLPQTVAGVRVNLAHLPYVGDSHSSEDRYKEYRIPQSDIPLICGHVHDAWTFHGNQINVGVDAPLDGVPGTMWDYTPVSEEQLGSYLEKM